MRKKIDKRQYQIDYILERCSPEPNTGCFLWTEKHIKGHPYVIPPFAMKPFPVRVSRLLWELVNQRKLGKLELWRTCGVKSCLNLAHMEVVDPDGKEPGNRRLLSKKIRAWQKDKQRRARRFEEWLRVNNGSDTSR